MSLPDALVEGLLAAWPPDPGLRIVDLDRGDVGPGLASATLAVIHRAPDPQDLQATLQSALAAAVADLPRPPGRPGPTRPPSARVSPDLGERLIHARDHRTPPRFRDVAAVRDHLDDRGDLLVVLLAGRRLARSGPGVGVGVLLPIGIETRVDHGGSGWRLRLRLIPDEASLDQHDPAVSAVERADWGYLQDALGTHLAQYPADVDAARTWLTDRLRDLTARHGPARAAWLLQQLVVRDPPSDVPGGWAQVRGLPPAVDVWLLVAGVLRHAHRLYPDPDAPPGSFADACRDGWGVILHLPDLGVSVPEQIEAVLVCGLGREDPRLLLDHHLACGRLAVLPSGSATNSVNGRATPDPADDPAQWEQPTVDRALVDLGLLPAAPTLGPAAMALGEALLGDDRGLAVLPGGALDHTGPGRALLSALRRVLIEHPLSVLWPPAGSWQVHVTDWAVDNLDPEGPLPAVRIGPQPYAVLPVTCLHHWPPDATPESAIREKVLTVRALAAAVADQFTDDNDQVLPGGTICDTEDPGRVVDLLARGPWPQRLAWRALITTADRTVNGVDVSRTWDEASRPLADHGLAPNVAVLAHGPAAEVSLPLVLPRPYGATDPYEVLLRTVRDRAGYEALGQLSLLMTLLGEAYQLNLQDLAHEAQGAYDAQVGQLVRILEDADAAEESGNRGARAAAVRGLTRALRATLDSVSQRVDPWATGLAYAELRRRGPRRGLGVYGWVDGPLTDGAPGPVEQSLVHAPSAEQVRTAALLSDPAVSDAAGLSGRPLDSAGLRAVAGLLEQVRAGSSVQEVLGRAVEDVLGVARPAMVAELRREHPLGSGDAGRRTCDGQQALSVWQTLRACGSDPLPGWAITAGVEPLTDVEKARLDGLAGLPDLLGDVLIAEGVHGIVVGRPALAGAALDAASGLGAPPELALLATPNRGRTVTTHALLALPVPPDRDDPELSPRRIAEPAVAQYLKDLLDPDDEWTWMVEARDGAPAPQSGAITLARLGLEPVDTAAITPAELESLVRDAACGGVCADPERYTVHWPAGDRQRRAGDLLRLVTGRPTRAADLAANTAGDLLDDLADDLAYRRNRVQSAAAYLRERLQDWVEGGLSGLFADGRDTTWWRGRARSWGIVLPPLTQQDLRDALELGSAAHLRLQSMVAALQEGAAKLQARLDADDLGGGSVGQIIDQIGALVGHDAPTPVLARLPAELLPFQDGSVDSQVAAEWLTVVAAVRPATRALEAWQLDLNHSPWQAWSTHGNDPWCTQAAGQTTTVLLHGPQAPTAEDAVAVMTLDTWSELVPDKTLPTRAAFRFATPTAQPPQALLVPVAPPGSTVLTAKQLADTIVETRELARARMARLRDAPDYAAAVPLAVVESRVALTEAP